jgi:hypothetical protein
LRASGPLTCLPSIQTIRNSRGRCGRENRVLPASWPPYDPGMDLRIATIAERPALTSRFASEETEPWPAFMNEDPIAGLYFSDVRIAHPEFMAASSRPGRRPDRWHLQARDGHPRHAR